ncbi:aspartyl protease family protein At5g10770-like [Hordeum vulgare subsp. vulgare]|uniref:aspartyl protease family protein At5g10770-like n=1 Tax=Hordeum vulgare subsp. vulgare TaxID=112509 RepID=UPI001D1A4905|nr:aspartyl protease family protein At5g10770-like [Hordeum vulgare subsp. vulgare]
MIQLLGKAGSQAFYVLLLQAIIVDRQQLEVPLSVFSAESVLDSVTVITRLSTAAYVALSAAFKAGMTEYPPVPPNGILDTCFNFTDKINVTMPRVALVFDEGAVVELDADGVMDSSYLAFAVSDHNNTIGNVQQQGFEVLHDIVQGVVGFRAGAC